MSCSRRWQTLVSAYADGELDPSQTAQVQAHLTECPQCRNRLDQWNCDKNIFSWAYTQQIVEGDMDTKQIPSAPSAESHSAGQPRRLRSAKLRGIAAFALAAIVISVLVIPRVMWLLMPTISDVGTTITTGSKSSKLRMGWDVSLQIGPNTRLIRTGERAFKLTQGWVEAVVSGRPIAMSSNRMSITDMGTKFEVGTNSKFDYAKVSRGWVWVGTKNGRKVKLGENDLLLTDGKNNTASGHLNIAPRNQAQPSSVKPEDVSETTDVLMHRCIEQMKKRYPNLVLGGSGSTLSNASAGRGTVFGLLTAAGYEPQIESHYIDILRALSGGCDAETSWRIPTALLMVSELGRIGSGVQPALVELVMDHGKLSWQLSGSNGQRITVSANTAVLPKEINSNTSRDTADVSVKWILSAAELGSSSGVMNNSPQVIESFSLPAWPANLRPYLSITLGSIPISQLFPREIEVGQEITRKIAANNGIRIEDPTSLTYLNRSLTDYMGFFWNKQLNDKPLSDGAILGVFHCTKPLITPRLAAGTYYVLINNYGKAGTKLMLRAADGSSESPLPPAVSGEDKQSSHIHASQFREHDFNWGYRLQGNRVIMNVQITGVQNKPSASSTPAIASGVIEIDLR